MVKTQVRILIGKDLLRHRELIKVYCRGAKYGTT